MAKLTFNLLGYSYQSGIETLEKSYHSASEALENDIDLAAENAWAYQQAQEQGAEFIGEKDECGLVIWDQQDVLNFQHELAQEALHMLRRSYSVSLYHHWERGTRASTNLGHDAKHEQLAEALTKLGIPVAADVHILRMIANLLKHGNEHWGEKLFHVAPEVIPNVASPTQHVPDWFEAVLISAKRMNAFFAAVKASGPTAESVW